MRIEANINGKMQTIEIPDGSSEDQINDVLSHVSVGKDEGMGRAALQGFNSAVPFGERAVAGLGALVAAPFVDESISDLYNEQRANQKATAEANPNAYLGGGLAGTAATLPVGLSRAVSSPTALGKTADVVNKASTAVGNFVRGGEVAKDATRLAKASNLAGKAVRGSLVAAPTGALYGYGAGEEGSRAEAAAKGAGLGVAGAVALPVIAGAAGAGVAALTPKIESGLLDVAVMARKYGIPLSLDQVTGSRVLKNAQKVSQELPFSGQQAFRDKQMRSFNRALFKTVGVDADLFNTKTMNMAFSKVGGEFDNITKGKTFSIGGDFVDNLAATAEDVRSQYGDEAFQAFQREAAKVINDFKGDAISGELISRQRSRINALARKATSGQKEALLDLENVIVDCITAGDEVTQKALSQAKQRYKNLIVLEPIANKAKGGMISPSLLNSRVSQVYKRAHTVGESGDIGNLARVGSELLPELGGSDTTQKLLTAGAITGGVANPASAIPVAAGLATNRALQSGVNRNQKVIDKAILRQIQKLPPKEAKAALEQLRGTLVQGHPTRIMVNPNQPNPYRKP